MLMWSVRINPKRIAAGCAAAAGIALVLFAAKTLFFPEREEVMVNAGSADPVVKNVTAKSNEQRMEFIRQFGWEIEEDPCEIQEVLIPKEFDSTYQSYNEIQRAQGLNLERFRGKKAKRYSYTVKNYPGEDGEVRLNLLVAENKVIGGDVCSMTPGGFLHGLSYDPEPSGTRQPVPELSDGKNEK